MAESENKLGGKLRKLRKQKELSLDELAEKAGMSKSYLWKLENHGSTRPSAETLSGLADVLGVSIAYFLDDACLPEQSHIDDAFFRNYMQLDVESKNQMRKILDTFRK